MDIGSTGLSAMKAAGDIAKDVGKDKIAGVLGNAFPFWGLRRRAVDAYIKDIENSNLPPETKMLMILNTKKTYKELQNQMAIAEIAHNVAKEGTNFTTESKVDEEWLSRYMDAGKHVSDEEVQLLWGNILAGEFEEPGHTPPSVIRILSEITPKYAKIFSSLCSTSVVWLAGKTIVPEEAVNVVILPDKKLYENLDINFETLNELELLGLIRFDLAGFVRTFPVDHTYYIYLKYGSDLLCVKANPKQSCPIGCVILTEAGRCISNFTHKAIIPGHLDQIKNYLQKEKFGSFVEPMISITESKTETDTEYSFEILPKAPPQMQELR